MLAEFLEHIQSTTIPSETVTIETVNGKDAYLYTPSEQRYERVAFIPREKPLTVSEIESLARLVRLEASKTGGAVVVFSSYGATFLPGNTTLAYGDGAAEASVLETGRVATEHCYTRRYSPQWAELRKVLTAGTKLSHLEFLRALQRLRPSIPEYATIFSAYQRVSLDANTKATNSPLVLRDGGASSIAFNVSLKSGTAEVKLPAEFDVILPLTRFGSPQEFAVEVDINVSADGKVLFGLIAPEMDLAEEEAISSEVVTFERLIKEAPVTGGVTVLVNL